MSKDNRKKANRKLSATNDILTDHTRHEHGKANPKNTTRQSQAAPTPLRACRTQQERYLLTVIARNQGILTHELGERFGIKSNNHHNTTQTLNPRLIRMGWVIYKLRPETSGSWHWYLEPVFNALQRPIHKNLRRTIHKHMEAAND